VSVTDKVLTCRDCHDPFIWTAGEQIFFREKELRNIPARCTKCRAERKTKLGLTNRPQTDVTCAMCGKGTTVPFVPRNGRPVYCSTCLGTARAEAAVTEAPAQAVASTPAEVSVTL
jgi:CxxC-x17-CxxC domain-containing protein